MRGAERSARGEASPSGRRFLERFRRPFPRRAILSGAAAAAGLLVLAAGLAFVAYALPATGESELDAAGMRAAVAKASGGLLELRGVVRFKTGLEVDGTHMGGISALAWDDGRQRLYALSDDRDHSPGRFYTLRVDLGDGCLDEGDLAFEGVTLVLDRGGEPYADGAIDAEGLAFAGGDTLYVSSEGDSRAGLPPWIREVSLGGSYRRDLPVPGHFLPARREGGGLLGVRNNMGFEALTLTPGGKELYAAVESDLEQDGPNPSPIHPSRSRVLRFELPAGRLVAEYLYPVDPVAAPTTLPGGISVAGLTELLALPEGAVPDASFLALERSFSLGVGFRLRLYRVRFTEAEEVTGVVSLPEAGLSPRTADKTLLLDFAEAGLPLDNYEALALGPRWPDGRRSLLVASDNNFSPAQATYFLAFALPADEEAPREGAGVRGSGGS